tara:strand:+ start:777 stop:1040 length:264 start_codon:yes stop_codon:yes gene_type:complete
MSAPKFLVTPWNWEESADGAAAAEALEDKLNALPPAKKKELFSALNDSDQDYPQFYLDLEDAVIKETLKEYATWPQSGHGLQVEARE